MESHRKHGYQPRCPEIVWDADSSRYNCRLMQDPVHGASSRKALLQGKGCCAPLNPWREHVRNRDPLPAIRPDSPPAQPAGKAPQDFA